MKIIPLQSKRLLVVDEVPEDSSPYISWRKGTNMLYKYYNSTLRRYTMRRIVLPSGQWRLVGRLKDITEGQAKEIVQSVKFGMNLEKIYEGYRDYENNQAAFFKALQSLSSFAALHSIHPEDLLLIEEI